MKKVLAYILPAVLLYACDGEQSQMYDAGAELALVDSVTSINVDNDSSALWIGTSSNSFFRYDLLHSTVERYYLPDSVVRAKTYAVCRVSTDNTGDERFIVCRRNNCATYIEYEKSGNVKMPDRYAQLSLPHSPLPDKLDKISIYNIVSGDSAIYLGSTNGLQYLTRHDIERLHSSESAHDSLRLSAATEHLRKSRSQFLHESIVDYGDSLLLATDIGLFSLAKKDIDTPRSEHKIASGRFWHAIKSDDKLYVLFADSSAQRYISIYDPAKGMLTGQRATDATATLLIGTSDSIIAIGSDGRHLSPTPLTAHNELAQIGESIYFIRDGRVCSTSTGGLAATGREYAAVSCDNFILSDTHGLWQLSEKGEYVFLGQISGLPPVRTMSASPDGRHLFMIANDGVYTIATTRYLFPGKIHARRIIANEPEGSEQIVSLTATDSHLLLGSRNGLRCASHTGDILNSYRFLTDTATGQTLDSLYESAYVESITPLNRGQYIVATLNNGNWLLDNIVNQNLKAIGGDRPTDEQQENNATPKTQRRVYLPSRPWLTWDNIGDLLKVVVLIIAAIICSFSTYIYIQKRRHRRQLRHEQRKRVRLYTKLSDQISTAFSNKAIGRNIDFARLLSHSAIAFSHYASDPDNDSFRNESEEAVHKLNRYCRNDIITTARTLAENFPKELPQNGDEYIFGAMAHFRNRVADIVAKLTYDNVVDNLHAAVLLTVTYQHFLRKLFRRLRSLRCSESPGEYFTLDHFRKLWSAIVTIDSVHRLNAISYGLFEDYTTVVKTISRDNTDPSKPTLAANRGEVTFSALAFYGIAKPKIAFVEPLQNSCRSFYDFCPKRNSRGSENHGSAYKMIMQAITPEIITGQWLPTILPSLGDIFWIHYFRQCHTDIVGLRSQEGVEKSLYTAIVAAWNLAHPEKPIMM